MAWKAGLTVSNERSSDRVGWPGQTSCAAAVVIDLSVPAGDGGIRPADLQTEVARYGFDVALPRILERLDHHGVRATFPVPAVVASQERDAVQRVVDAGHEIAGHGLRHENVTGLSRDEEARRIDQVIAALSAITEERPAGWFSLARQNDRYPGGSVTPNTIDLLIERGFKYFGNSQADDVPHYWIVDPTPKKALLALPYSYHCDDQFFIDFPPGFAGTMTERVSTLERIWNEELDAMIGTAERQGYNRAVTAVIHPYLNGWGQRLLALDRFLDRIANQKSIWVANGSELASYWMSTYPLSGLEIGSSDWKG